MTIKTTIRINNNNNKIGINKYHNYKYHNNNNNNKHCYYNNNNQKPTCHKLPDLSSSAAGWSLSASWWITSDFAALAGKPHMGVWGFGFRVEGLGVEVLYGVWC